MVLELKKFINDLQTIEEAMYKGAANATYPQDKKLFKALNGFHENLFLCNNIFQSIQDDIKNNYINFISGSQIESDISRVLVMLNTEVHRENKLNSNFNVTEVFKTLAEKIVKLKAILKTLLKRHTNLHKNDEVFQPNNVDKNEILTYLDNAIKALAINTTIETSVKDNLLNYINETKVELKKESLSWKKIIGGLVIVAAILSGIADAPEALKNIEDAYNYIMGNPFSSSIQKEIIYKNEQKKINTKEDSGTTIV